MRYSTFWPQCARWWDDMVIKPDRVGEFTRDAQYAINNKAQYIAVERATGWPWTMAAVVHRRESDGDFNTYLGNGQRLSMRTTIVPKNRGPFRSFLEGAIDAARVEGWANIQDWRLEKQLYYCLLVNGAYSAQSPYLWGGTSIQKRGKYVRDHVYNPFVWDPQPGCAPLFQMIAKLDKTVQFVREN